jgi:4-aminobutyrate aminotransferase/(S)-3-amino-2-methylpropionate transaminase
MILKMNCRPREGYRIFNTWMGEPSKVVLLEKVIDVIKRDKLIENVKVTGSSVNFEFPPSSLPN